MKCIYCNFENEQDFAYCPGCGASQTPVISLNPAADKILCALKDKCFLAICILLSISCGLSIVEGNLPLINILATIFLWITFSKSRNGIADKSSLRNVSGTVYAQYIINYILFSFVFLLGILIAFLFNVINGTPELLDEVIAEFNMLDDSYINIVESIFSISGFVIMALFTFIAVIGILINVFSMRKIHRLAKSVYEATEDPNTDFKCANAAKIWLFIFGVCTAITAASSLFGGEFLAAVNSGCSAAAQIIAGLLINKYLLSDSQSI